MLRVLTLVQKTPGQAPNQRFRHEQWAPYLRRDHDIELDFSAFESPELGEILYRRGRTLAKARSMIRDTRRRWKTLDRVRSYDAVAVLREAAPLGGALLERAIAATGVPLIFDFDDAIWRWVPGPNGLLSLARMPWKTRSICGAAAAVTVGNRYLETYARRVQSDVTVVRTSIDLSRFPLMDVPPDASPFTIAWTGSHSTLTHLESIRSALEDLGRRRPTRLRVVCDVPPKPFEHVELDFRPWSAETEAVDLAPAHVGIMPLPDTPFTRGKCGCKALQYMAIGRPAVVTPVGINTEIVHDGVNGLFASTPAEWTDRLDRLASDAGLRARMGAAARHTVLTEGFSAEDSAREFARVVRRATGRVRSVRETR